MSLVLGIETSCDETSVAVLEFRKEIRQKSNIPWVRELSMIVLSQEIHSRYGGVVPELASRAHIENIVPVYEEAIKRADISPKDIDLIAVAGGPGLPGSLMVGVNFAKGLSQALSKKIILVNHVEAHVLSPLIENDISLPFFSLVVSGGHTTLYLVKEIGKYELLIKTQDDAAGEAFDKIAKIFRLPYPGGPVIDSISSGKTPLFSFPDVQTDDFSFSGLKTFCLRFSQRWFGPFLLPEFLASAQKKIVDEIVEKIVRRISKIPDFPDTLAIVGGVARNSYMRNTLEQIDINGRKLKVIFPHPKYCIDNATMIAFAGALRNLLLGEVSEITDDVNPTQKFRKFGGII